MSVVYPGILVGQCNLSEKNRTCQSGHVLFIALLSICRRTTFTNAGWLSKDYSTLVPNAGRKCICNFRLVINSTFGRISYHFQDIDT